MYSLRAEPLPEQCIEGLIELISNWEPESDPNYTEYTDYTDYIANRLYEINEVTFFDKLRLLASECTPRIEDYRDEDAEIEPNEDPLMHYRKDSELFRKDFLAEYRVYVDAGVYLARDGDGHLSGMRWDMQDELGESIVAWSKSARQNSQQFFAKVDVAIIDRCDSWDGFVIRDKHIAYTRAKFHIRTNLPRRQFGDFTVGAVIVSPGSHAVCGYCSESWDLGAKTALSRTTQEDITLSIIEHSLTAHDPENKREHVRLDRTEEVLALPQFSKWPRQGIQA
jgi:hypothetical protein